MGIINISIITQPEQDSMRAQAHIALQEKLMAEHRRGFHLVGRMIHECPLCQLNKR